MSVESSSPPAALAGDVIDEDSVRSWVERTLWSRTRSTMPSASASPPLAVAERGARGDVRERDAHAVHVVERLVEAVAHLVVEERGAVGRVAAVVAGEPVGHL